MEYESASDGNVPFSNFDHMSYIECPTESDDDLPEYDTERKEQLETLTGDVGRFMQLFTNTSRVYMFSNNIFEDVSFHDFKPQMKLDICICFVESMGSFFKDEKWVRELK
ncbi:hypothetical protein MKW94_013779 [Papaver nudicaule]|uniref:Uncharacterized protein n=1 Tax=Papaver nudicaule TaxID=74823 RepID=A0AA41VBY0_PAPNU|nr:hypothetical protein [Papaver nudicaule]